VADVIDYARAPGPGLGAQTARGHKRRTLILTVAGGLFAENGYDGVSITDIGVAAGITGPAIYRYFPGKEDILVSIYQDLYRQSLEAVQAVTLSDGTPLAKLEMLVKMQIELATGQPERIRIVDSEARHLPPDTAKAFAQERRRILKVWTDLVREVRPDLEPDRRDVTVHGTLALINSISLRRSSARAQPELCDHLKAMAMAGILQPSNRVDGRRRRG
jgi:AcrR family transcriptional regulator